MMEAWLPFSLDFSVLKSYGQVSPEGTIIISVLGINTGTLRLSTILLGISSTLHPLYLRQFLTPFIATI